MLIDYVPVLIMILVGFGFGAAAVIVSSLLGPRRRFKVKREPYECGLKTDGATYIPTSIKYYVVALLFLVFDLECVFLYPWAVYYKEMGFFGFAEMMVFIGILLVCYVYVWKRGALEWD